MGAGVVRFLSRGWRDELAGVAASARRSVLVAAPYIKEREAAWLCERLRPGVRVLTLASIDAGAVGGATLDLGALGRLAAASPGSRVVALPRLHAKVYAADETAAIVTSGNLTRSALDRNIECGVLLDDPAQVRALRAEMESLVPLGSEVDAAAIRELAPFEAELRRARARVEDSASPAARRAFARVMRRARPAFAGAQVGERSAHAMFADALRFVLARGPLATRAIHDEMRALLPDLCDDREELIINGERYGSSAWKRRVRHAQLHLRRQGVLRYDPAARLWGLAAEQQGSRPPPRARR